MDVRDIRQLHYYYNGLYSRFTTLLDRKGIEYRTRREVNYNLYFNDPSVFKMALKAFKQDVLEISGPANPDHLTAMRNNRKIVVRDSLWYKKYRFKVTYRATSDFKENIVPNIISYKRDLTKDEIKLSSNIYKILETPKSHNNMGGTYSSFRRFVYTRGVQPWHLCTVYLDNEDNYVMYKMMVGGDSESEQEILLLSELESDK